MNKWIKVINDKGKLVEIEESQFPVLQKRGFKKLSHQVDEEQSNTKLELYEV